MGGEFSEAIIKVAKDFPETQFLYQCVLRSAPNVSVIYRLEEEMGYINAVIAARMTKTNKVAYIGGMGIPCVHAYAWGFKWGVEEEAKKLGKKIEVYEALTGSFVDPVKGYDTAKGLIDLGVDFICNYAIDCEPGILKAIKEAGPGHWAIDSFFPKTDMAPGQIVITQNYDDYMYMREFFKLVLSGYYPFEWVWWAGFWTPQQSTGIHYFHNYPDFHIDVPSDVKDAFYQAIDDLVHKRKVVPRYEIKPAYI
jgi:hypothetical protein